MRTKHRKGTDANIYSLELAGLLTTQLIRFASLNPHQLSGHFANLEFWLDEVRHAFSVIDGYHRRFEGLRDAQVAYVQRHATQRFVQGDFLRTAEDVSRPMRAPDAELKVARRALGDAAYRFLVRCYKAGVINKEPLRDLCNQLGIGVDLRDLTV